MARTMRIWYNACDAMEYYAWLWELEETNDDFELFAESWWSDQWFFDALDLWIDDCVN